MALAAQKPKPQSKAAPKAEKSHVFAWEGMGALFNRGLQAVDVNLVMGFFLVTGLFAVIGNLVADLLYSSLDPRIRVS